jgi:NAD+ synthase
VLNDFDPVQEAERLIEWTRQAVHVTLKREGVVVGVSGGVDSATVLHLAVRALGPSRVVALIMPDRDSSPASADLALDMIHALGVEAIQTDITPTLEALHCYENRDLAVKRAVSEFDPDTDKIKIVLPQDLLGGASLNVFTLVVIKPDGREIRRRLRPAEFQEIVAASNLKQRIRMVMLYHEAERRNWAVAGTAQKNEHELGFFVKYGDGGADLQPLHHLFKTQVYGVAEHLGVPAVIRERPPTTDTYSAECTQEEFFYRLPFDVLDAIWEASECGLSPQETAARLRLTVEQVENALFDIRRKQATTAYLRAAPLSPSAVAAPELVESGHTEA